MIQPISIINVLDNSGVNSVKCIKIFKKKPKTIGKINHIFLGVVISTKKLSKKKIKKGDLVFCLFFQSKINQQIIKNSGIFNKNYNQNGALLITKKNHYVFEHKSSRIFSFIHFSTSLKYPKIKNLNKNVV